MSDMEIKKIHWSFWVISIFMLLWNVMGSMNFFWQISADAETLATLPETHRAIIDSRPIWATVGFAVGVITGSFGCLLLLFKKSEAVYLFIVSLSGIIVTMIHTIKVSIMVIEFSIMETIVMIVMPLIVAAFLIWYTRKVEGKGWIS
ncbi:MAG: hypothetical protein OEX07_11465 [Gammaproteobacteria bacterium]|nr:hypothetical protein [Gammaproteobacteria bacterium]